ncbi:hypothetical protein FA15DRAFT_670996 [Coprinopsis marcescibilis]|uniref:Uncharacterized protein n=1 Tax=Coprinopsis marcescibilis TaxID=230819 RepID=A0A5C3L469_COPMA|nr:hypothetical protein FA15DRAFT_670996 [Coprinopsis marcescibilis]
MQYTIFIPFLILIVFQPQTVHCAITNRTIDDTNGDSVLRNTFPIYQPPNSWVGATCNGCWLTPDPSQALGRTWSETTWHVGSDPVFVQLQFQGVAIYVFFILANDGGPGTTTYTECDFILDEGEPSTFIHAPDLTTTAFLYNQSVYSRTGLPNANHTLEIVIGNGLQDVYLNFDYAIYSYDDTPPVSSTSDPVIVTASPTPPPNPDPPPSSELPTAAIVGGVAGGVIGLALLILVLVCLLRRRRRIPLEPMPLNGNDLAMHNMDPRAHRLSPPLSNAPSREPWDYLSNVNPSTHGRAPRGPQPADVFSAPYGSGIGTSDSQLRLVSTNESQRPFAFGNLPVDDRRSPFGAPATRTESVFSAPYGIGHSTPSLIGFDPAAVPYNAEKYTPLSPATTPSERNRVLLNENPSTQSGIERVPSQLPAVPLTVKQLQLRRERQAELERQLLAIDTEMEALNRGMGEGGESTAEFTARREIEGMSVEEMREQMRMMQQQIAILRHNQGSDWAEGLTDDPPPGYTPRQTSGLF